MNKSKSVPINLCEQNSNPIKKSPSLPELDECSDVYEDFFEGDGPLGIIFFNQNENAVIRNIKKDTVADEYYKLKVDMVLTNINNKDITKKSYDKILSMIRNEWNQNNSIYLKFKKNINPIIHKILLENELLDYYDDFIELGAKDLSDFEFIELNDLIKMKMKESEILRFKNINPLI